MEYFIGRICPHILLIFSRHSLNVHTFRVFTYLPATNYEYGSINKSCDVQFSLHVLVALLKDKSCDRYMINIGLMSGYFMANIWQMYGTVDNGKLIDHEYLANTHYLNDNLMADIYN